MDGNSGEKESVLLGKTLCFFKRTWYHSKDKNHRSCMIRTCELAYRLDIYDTFSFGAIDLFYCTNTPRAREIPTST